MKRSITELKPVILAFLLWRGLLFLWGIIALRLLEFKASFPLINESLIISGYPQWLWQWGNFDGVHYLTVARHGYAGLINGEQVFFPVYPLLIKLVSFLTGNLFLAGLLIANVSALLAAILLYKLVSRDLNKNVAFWSVIFLFAFPTSFFFGAVYTEALFLLLLLLAFFLPGIAGGIAGLLAGGVRLVGAFLAPTAIFKPLNRWRIIAAGGVLSYMFYLWRQFGNPLLFLFNQGAFKNARANTLSGLVTPPQVLYRYLRIFLTASVTHYDFWVAVLEFTAFLFGVGILTWLTVRRKVPLSYLVYSWPALVLPVFSGTLSSLPRYLLTVFPVFIGLALIKNRPFKIGLAILFALLEVVLTTFFVRGYWVS